MGTDTVSAYYGRVAEQISRALVDRGMTQKHLAKECESRFGIEISQSTISKIRNSEGGHMSAVFVCAICQVLEINLTSVLSLQGEDYGGDSESAAFLPVGGEPESGAGSETLIRDPRNDAFIGYIDKEYDIFYWSTNSNENQLVHGTMALSNHEDQYCKVYLCLDGKRQEYAGRMAISLQQQACYCTVESRRLGEQWSFVFYHRFFFEDSLKVRLAAVCGVSAGDARRPTVQRMLICGQGVIGEDRQRRDFVAAQLLMNNAKIIVPEKKYDRLQKDEDLHRLLAKLEREPEPFYVFDESEIRILPGYEFNQLADAIARLRMSSIAHHYNKIGGKADELLYKYLFKYPAQEELGEEE